MITLMDHHTLGASDGTLAPHIAALAHFGQVVVEGGAEEAGARAIGTRARTTTETGRRAHARRAHARRAHARRAHARRACLSSPRPSSPRQTATSRPRLWRRRHQRRRRGRRAHLAATCPNSPWDGARRVARRRRYGTHAARAAHQAGGRCEDRARPLDADFNVVSRRSSRRTSPSSRVSWMSSSSGCPARVRGDSGRSRRPRVRTTRVRTS